MSVACALRAYPEPTTAGYGYSRARSTAPFTGTCALKEGCILDLHFVTEHTSVRARATNKR